MVPGRSYKFELHGKNFIEGQTLCRLNDVVELSLKFFNSTYIECTWASFAYNRRYIVSVSTNRGNHWVYAYDQLLTFLTLPKVLKAHPPAIPNNLETLLQIEFREASLHTLQFFQVKIGPKVFDLSEMELLN